MTPPCEPLEGCAYTAALAHESFEPADGTFDPATSTFTGVTFGDLERFARIVAYKVAHNLEAGMKMDPLTDPLLYVDCEDYPCLLPRGENLQGDIG